MKNQPYVKVDMHRDVADVTVMRYAYRPGQREIADALPFTGTTVTRRPFERPARFRSRVERRAKAFLEDCKQDWKREQSWEIR